MADPILEFHDDPSPEVTEPLRDALRAFNESRIGPYRMRPLAVLARGDRGELTGGIQGVLGFGWLYVERLWVLGTHRGRGLGKTLLERLESAAIERGARRAALLSATWQAPEFYERCGYEAVAAFDLIVDASTDETAHVDYLFVKQLQP